MSAPHLILASTSPRRRLLLEEAGFSHQAVHPGVDDAQLVKDPSITPEHWVGALAYLKASAALRLRLRTACPPPGVIVLAADTIVVKEGEVIGQPRHADDARRILRRLERGSHRVLTGFAMIYAAERRIGVDLARVEVGEIGSERIEAYIASGGWRGKAGAYNLSERLADGWPIAFEGDPATIMGLPMIRLTPVLNRLLSSQASEAGA